MSAASLYASALEHYRRQDYSQAVALFRRAAEAYRVEGDRSMAAEMQNNLGVVYRAQRNFPAALSAVETALTEFRALNDSRRTALALGNLGNLLLETGELDRAASALVESLDHLDPQTDKAARSEVLRVLGEVRLKQGKWLEGMADYEAGLHDVENPSPQQVWLKKLLGIPMRMMGRGE